LLAERAAYRGTGIPPVLTTEQKSGFVNRMTKPLFFRAPAPCGKRAEQPSSRAAEQTIRKVETPEERSGPAVQ
jgi:hypothetical protein